MGHDRVVRSGFACTAVQRRLKWKLQFALKFTMNAGRPATAAAALAIRHSTVDKATGDTFDKRNHERVTVGSLCRRQSLRSRNVVTATSHARLTRQWDGDVLGPVALSANLHILIAAFAAESSN